MIASFFLSNMKKEVKTNAMRILDKNKISYEVHTYNVDDGELDGVSVARKCNEAPNKVFKTLVTISNTKEYFVFVIPVEDKLNLKEAAKEVGVKSIEMIPQKDLLPLTGYIHGGCSPVGMKKLFKTFIYESCLNNETIYVSGGKVGIQIEVNPSDLLKICNARTFSNG